jgi:hypothetical protein
MLARIPPNNFLEHFAKIHDEVFAPPSALGSPFTNPAWEMFLIGYDFPSAASDVERLRVAADAVGDKRVILSGESYSTFDSLLLDFSLEDFLGASREMICVANDNHLFYLSGAWGLCATHEDYSIVAGIPAFVDAYAASAGGRDVIKREFLDLFFLPGRSMRRIAAGRQLVRLARWDLDL